MNRLQKKAERVHSTLQILRPMVQSEDELIYAFLSTCAQTESTINGGNPNNKGFMTTFDYNGILQSVGHILSLSLSFSFPLLLPHEMVMIRPPPYYQWKM